MLPRLLVAVVGLVFAGMAATAQAVTVTIDPDDYLSGTNISNLTDGITLSTVVGQSSSFDPIYAMDWYPAYGNVFASLDMGLSFGPDNHIAFRADFEVPTDYISILSTGSNNINSTTLYAYNTSGTQIASIFAGNVYGEVALSIIRTNSDISYILAGGTVSTTVSIIDLLEFNRIIPPQQAAVPLPAALPLYGTGLAIMGFIGWRRKRKASASV